jgi:hypothetical protein
MHQSGEEIGVGGAVSRFLRLIRFSHTIFALPFALGALVVATNGWPSVRILILVLVCMVFARTAAMYSCRLVITEPAFSQRIFFRQPDANNKFCVKSEDFKSISLECFHRFN